MQRSNLARLAVVATLCSSLAIPATAFAETWFADSDLTGTASSQPEQDAVKPNAGQLKYARDEFAAFCHFGPNTFSGWEWGEKYGKDGNPTATEFMERLESFDADSYVKMIKEAGFTRLIVTAKHHDGFCIWNSESTEYDMGSTSRRIDILAELSRACTEQDLDMGLYLSPWDIDAKSYGSSDGDADNYNDFYDGQLREILGNNEKYGNNGKFVEVWMDGAKGTGQDAQNYDFKRFADTIKELEGEDCVLFQCGQQAEVRWVGNEHGLAGNVSWNRVKMKPNWDSSSTEVAWDKNIKNDPTVGADVSVGDPAGEQWIMPEADARITGGWFWHENQKAPKSLTELGTMYFNSVGHGAPLLLNVPPNNQGTVDPEIRQRTLELGENIKQSFKDDLTRAGEGRDTATAKASSAWQDAAEFGPGKVLDGNDDTYWSAKSAEGTHSLLVELDGEQTFNVVSFEEAIQNGQRIKDFKVSYRDAAGKWVEYGTGGTVGAKRLVRGATVTATAIKIDVTTLEGKVAQISEVGVFKTSKGFEKPSPVPAGMQVIDNTGDGGMTTTGTWNKTSQANAIEGTSMWSKEKGASASFTFTGTRFLLLGTVDPNHGKAKVTIDGGEPFEVDTRADKRATSVVLYASDTLTPGEHTVKVEVAASDKAIGLDAAAYLDNKGIGMLDFDEARITMDEASEYELGITRTGGSEGAVEVMVNFEPGSAVQGDFDTTPQRVTFAAGEMHKTVTVRTKRSEGSSTVGDAQFSVTMQAVSPEGLVIGTKDDVIVTIKDRESTYTLEKLKEAIKAAEAAAANAGQYTTETVRALDHALVSARAVAAEGEPGADAIYDAIKALEAARAGLKARGAYSEADPFAFPSIVNATSTIEFELGSLNNDTAGDNGYPMVVAEREGASMGKLVNAVGENDTVSIPFTAARAGTYRAVLRFQSGSTGNKVVWADANASDPIIQAGEHAAGHNKDSEYRTVEFAFTVDKPGSSTLVFTGPSVKSPRLDKLDVTLTGEGLSGFGAVGRAGIGGSITPEGFIALEDGKATFTVAPDTGYRIKAVTKNGEAIAVADTASALDVEVTEADAKSSDAVVEALFEKVPAPTPDPEPSPEPEPTPKPEQKPDSQPGHKPGNGHMTEGGLAQTGDIASIAAPISLAATALLGAAAALKRKR